MDHDGKCTICNVELMHYGTTETHECKKCGQGGFCTRCAVKCASSINMNCGGVFCPECAKCCPSCNSTPTCPDCDSDTCHDCHSKKVAYIWLVRKQIEEEREMMEKVLGGDIGELLQRQPDIKKPDNDMLPYG